MPDWRLDITRQGSVVSTSIECMNIISYSKVSYDSRYSRNPLYSYADHFSRIAHTTHDGRNFRLCLPSRPCIPGNPAISYVSKQTAINIKHVYFKFDILLLYTLDMNNFTKEKSY